MLEDTHVLVNVLENDPDWADWSVAQLQAQSKVHQLVINPIIHAELSLTFSSVEALDQALDGMELRIQEIPKPALFLAGKAFAQYRRSGGVKIKALGDFFIGAHGVGPSPAGAPRRPLPGGSMPDGRACLSPCCEARRIIRM